jgi:hypothetical protein
VVDIAIPSSRRAALLWTALITTADHPEPKDREHL